MKFRNLEGGGSMARPRQPIELLLLKGNTHLTKEQIENRKKTQIKAPTGKVKPPDYLPKDLHEEFNHIAKELISIEIFSNLDVDTLARYLIAQKIYLDLTNHILSSDFEFNDKIINAQDKYFKQCRQCASDLGLTISSRCKLVIPKKEEDKTDVRDKRFGDV